MKATLEFELPIDQEEHRDALRGSEWRWAMVELMDYLRGQLKHADNSIEEYRTFERVRERALHILQDRNLELHP